MTGCVPTFVPQLKMYVHQMEALLTHVLTQVNPNPGRARTYCMFPTDWFDRTLTTYTNTKNPKSKPFKFNIDGGKKKIHGTKQCENGGWMESSLRHAAFACVCRGSKVTCRQAQPLNTNGMFLLMQLRATEAFHHLQLMRKLQEFQYMINQK